jgi:aminoglycoside phosphotransferase (APT) family kinase protein
MTAEPAAPPPEVAREMTTTVTDFDALRERFGAWLSGKVGAPVRIGELNRPADAGMSSVSVLLDAHWTAGGADEHADLVVRIPPDASAFPVFPSYDLRRQYEVMAAVAEHSAVPVPPLRWLEESPEAIGSPFIVMDRVAGQVPVDNPPYVFGGWYYDAAPAEQRAVQDATVDVLARLHAITDVPERFPSLAAEAGPDALRSHVDGQRAYYEWSRRDDGLRIPVIEDAFGWLEEHWPTDGGPPVLSWGDARIGNVIYRDFAPAAVLDWEMAALGPRELDLGWFVFLHRFFQDIAEVFEVAGLPELCRREDVVARYESASGHTVRDLDFYIVYAALRHALVMSRVKRRMIHFGEDTVPDDPNGYVMHAARLRELIS